MNRVMPYILILVSALLSSTAYAQSYADTVWTKLQEWYEDYSGDGYSVENYVVGKLDEGETDSWSFWLGGGNNYTIIGVCDEDCGDIDLAIFDDGDALVDEDVLEDDYPIVSVSPTSDELFTVDVDMYECDVEPCYFGIAIFYD
ncbi:MAG: hypothetical protein HOL48_09720 [Porticoccaceae bacterium]|jgi:hypothetical protein|nr:hypothetical protein [Porticoccaceae bacterium]